MRNKIGIAAGLLLTAVLFGGCASIRSTQLPEGSERGNKQGGMVYYLPTQQLELTMTVDDKGARLSLSPSKAMADVGNKYVAQFRRNHVGTNKFVVKANADGLLSGELSGSTVGNLGEAIKALATSTAGIQMLNSRSGDKCKEKGVYKWVFGVTVDLATEAALQSCGLKIDPRRLDGTPYSKENTPGALVATGSGMSDGPGFFYRQKLPVMVKVTHTATDASNASVSQEFVFYESVVGSHSPIEFMPVPRTLFATTQWKLNFDNGIPTVYDIDAGGDLIGLFKLPAEVVGAYSDAIAAGFTKEKTSLSNETAYLEQLNKLALQQARNEACRAAVQNGDSDKIKAACQ